MEIDTINKEIIDELSKDARQSLKNIAKKTRVSIVTIANRVNQLVKDGIIKEFTTKIDYDKLGYDLHVMIGLQVSHGKFDEVAKKVISHPSITAVYDTTGDYDLLVIARFKTRHALDDYVKKLQTLPHVERSSTSLILNVLQEKGLTL